MSRPNAEGRLILCKSVKLLHGHPVPVSVAKMLEDRFGGVIFLPLEASGFLTDEIFHQFHGDHRRADNPRTSMNTEYRRNASDFEFFDIEPRL